MCSVDLDCALTRDIVILIELFLLFFGNYLASPLNCEFIDQKFVVR